MSGHTTCSEAGPVAWRGGAFLLCVRNSLRLAILLFRCAQQSACLCPCAGQQPAEATRLPASRRRSKAALPKRRNA